MVASTPPPSSDLPQFTESLNHLRDLTDLRLILHSDVSKRGQTNLTDSHSNFNSTGLQVVIWIRSDVSIASSPHTQTPHLPIYYQAETKDRHLLYWSKFSLFVFTY